MKNIYVALAALALMGAVAGCSKASMDKAFVKEAIESDIADMRIADLAVQKATRPEVKDFAQSVSSDQTQARAQAEGVAGELGVAVPTDMSAAGNDAYNKLSNLEGADFDKEFLSYMVGRNQGDIEKFQAAAKSKDSRVAELANGQLPTLQRHLDTAKTLQGNQ